MSSGVRSILAVELPMHAELVDDDIEGAVTYTNNKRKLQATSTSCSK